MHSLENLIDIELMRSNSKLVENNCEGCPIKHYCHEVFKVEEFESCANSFAQWVKDLVFETLEG